MLTRRVLVLNRLWQPVNIVGMRRAVTLIFSGQASVVHRSAPELRTLDLLEWVSFSRRNPPEVGLTAATVTLHAPDVLLLAGYDRPPAQEVRFSRHAVFRRDGFRCQYCGGLFCEAELNLDHVVPRDRGGRTIWENIVTACLRCNARKADRLPHQAGMHLSHAPIRPTWRSFVAEGLSCEERRRWREFWPTEEKQKAPGDPAPEDGTGNRIRTGVTTLEEWGPAAERYPQVDLTPKRMEALSSQVKRSCV